MGNSTLMISVMRKVQLYWFDKMHKKRKQINIQLLAVMHAINDMGSNSQKLLCANIHNACARDLPFVMICSRLNDEIVKPSVSAIA